MAFKLAGAFVNLTAKWNGLRQVTGKVAKRLEALKAKMQAVAAASRRMLTVMGGVIGGTTALLYRQEKAEAKLAAVLRATGHAAGYSTEQLLEKARALQQVTTYGDEAVINLQAILATFKELKGDQFDQATEAALDMAAVLDQDLRSSAVQLGKALNDPLRGLTALSRVGVSFTQEQKATIARLTELGDTAGAQAVILRELQSEFGGAARAAAETSGGGLIQLKNALGDLGEVLGKAFAPMLRSFRDWVMRILPPIQAWVKANGMLIANLVKTTMAVGAILVLLPKLLGAFSLIVAHPVAAALVAIGAAVAYLVMHLRSVPNVTADVDANMGRLHKSTVMLQAADLKLGRRLDELMAKQQRTNAEQAEANRLARQLENRYGGLGVVYDRAGNAMHMAANGMERLRRAQERQLRADLKKDIDEATEAMDRHARQMRISGREAEAMGKKIMDTWGGWQYVPIAHAAFQARDAKRLKQMRTFTAEMDAHTQALVKARKRRTEAQRQLAKLNGDRDAGDRFTPLDTGPDLQRIYDAEQRTQQTITDLYMTESQRRVAAINRQYAQMETARADTLRTLLARHDAVNARLTAMSHARLTDEERAQQAALQRERQQLQHAIQQHQQQQQALGRWRVDNIQQTLARIEREEREAAAERKRNAQAEAWEAQQAALEARAAAMERFAADMQSLNDELYEGVNGRQAMEVRRLDRWYREMANRYRGNRDMMHRIDEVYYLRRDKIRQKEAAATRAQWVGLTDFYKRFQEAVYNQKESGGPRRSAAQARGQERDGYNRMIQQGDQVNRAVLAALLDIKNEIKEGNRQQRAPTPVGR